MKIFSIALICVVLISFAFIVPTNQKAATPIVFDDSQTGSYVYHNICANEDIDVNFRTDVSMRGTLNAQRVMVKLHTREQMEGVGQTSGTRYRGQNTFSGTQTGNMINGTYQYSHNISTRLISQGSGSNFKSNATLRYSVDAQGEASTSREQLTSECQ